MIKEQAAGLAYALYANDSGTRPTAFTFTGSELGARGTAALPLNAWSHLAASAQAVVPPQPHLLRPHFIHTPVTPPTCP